MKILLADDDSYLVDVTTYALMRRGHTVVSAFDGMQALQRWSAEQPDLVLLDAATPRLDGLEVCRRIRQSSTVPVIITSARGEDPDLVRGYECGADDYIVKPFSVRQLLLRVDAVMRRVAGAPVDGDGAITGRVDIGDLMIDLSAFEARKNGVRLSLTRLEFRILHCLARQAGQLVDTGRLATYAWRSPGSGDATLLKTHVSHIRQKLSDAGGDPVQIRAIPRTGYILSGSARMNGAASDFAMAVPAGD